MGLDMYLYKLEKEKIGYLRKANMIHYWIEKRILANNPEIKEIYNTEYYGLTYNDLKTLYCDIDFVQKNPNMAKEILPTRPGFFFGNLQYNKIYFDTLQETKKQLKKYLMKIHLKMCSYTILVGEKEW